MKGSSWAGISINDSCLFQETKVILEPAPEAADAKTGWYRKVEFCQFSHEIVSRPIRVTQDQHLQGCLGIQMLGHEREKKQPPFPGGKGVYFLLGYRIVPLSSQV